MFRIKRNVSLDAHSSAESNVDHERKIPKFFPTLIAILATAYKPLPLLLV